MLNEFKVFGTVEVKLITDINGFSKVDLFSFIFFFLFQTASYPHVFSSPSGSYHSPLWFCIVSYHLILWFFLNIIVCFHCYFVSLFLFLSLHPFSFIWNFLEPVLWAVIGSNSCIIHLTNQKQNFSQMWLVIGLSRSCTLQVVCLPLLFSLVPCDMSLCSDWPSQSYYFGLLFCDTQWKSIQSLISVPHSLDWFFFHWINQPINQCIILWLIILFLHALSLRVVPLSSTWIVHVPKEP